MDTYRLRLQVPALVDAAAEVVDAISGLGGSVVSVDLREVDGDAAVEEVVVEVPHQLEGAAALRSALANDSSAVLLSSQACARGEPAAKARQWAHETDMAENEDAQHDLGRRLSRACPLSAVWLASNGDVDSIAAVQMAVSRGTAVVCRSHDLPDPLVGETRSMARWLLAVPDRYPNPHNVALLSRPMSLPFTADEVARVELLMAS